MGKNLKLEFLCTVVQIKSFRLAEKIVNPVLSGVSYLCALGLNSLSSL